MSSNFLFQLLFALFLVSPLFYAVLLFIFLFCVYFSLLRFVISREDAFHFFFHLEAQSCPGEHIAFVCLFFRFSQSLWVSGFLVRVGKTPDEEVQRFAEPIRWVGPRAIESRNELLSKSAWT